MYQTRLFYNLIYIVRKKQKQQRINGGRISLNLLQ